MKPLLESISDELRMKIESASKRKAFAKDEVIFFQGDKAESLPIILSGKVKIVKYPSAGKEIIIEIFQSGEMFAVPPVFDGGTYPAMAVAIEDSELLLVSRAKFLELLKNSNEFAFAVIAWMSEMLRRKTAIIETISTDSPSCRIVRTLLRIFEKESSDRAKPFRISLRRQDIAEMASLTTETTIRNIRNLAGKGLLRIHRGKIYIDDVEPLRKFLEKCSE